MPLDVLNRVRRVLRVDPHEIHPAIASELAYNEVAHRDNRADGRAPPFEIREKPVLCFHAVNYLTNVSKGQQLSYKNL